MLPMVIYGSRVSPFTGPVEAAKGRVTIYQELIPELDGPADQNKICCRIFGPKETLAQWQEIFNLAYDSDFIEPCLRFFGDTGALMATLKRVIPNLEYINSDNDEVFAACLGGQD
jgi:hypothetical protein